MAQIPRHRAALPDHQDPSFFTGMIDYCRDIASGKHIGR
jgi:hypothetical protein